MLHQIGIGTLGPVFRTYEPIRDRLVAVKVFRLDIIPEQAQVLAEALSKASQSSLFHPSIVEPIAAGVEGTLAYRAEQYVAAESLDVAMRHYAPASLEKALPFITQLAGAIDFARAVHVGHGGLHPRDIFVTPDEARATGFGVVEALEQVGIRAPIRRPYSAPERIAGSPWSTPADVFSLAAIAFELLTGRRPAGTGAQAGSLPDGPHAAALHAVLARAMDDDPARRYPTALAFASALEAASRGETVPESLVPGSTVPGSAVPGSPVARSTVPESTVPGSRVPGSTVPGSRVPGSTVPGSAVPGSTVPASTVPGSTVPESTFPGSDEPTFVGLPEPKAPAPPPRLIAPPPVVASAPTPGEFAVEETLDPLHAALQDATIKGAAPTLFDDEVAEPPTVTRFADDFADHTVRDDSTIPAVTREDYRAPYATEGSRLVADEPFHEADEAPDRWGPAILPHAVTLVLGLLGGFAGGYFVGSRDRLAPVESAPSAIVQPAPGAAGPATPDKPGQYSEQKVTPPAAPARASTAATPTPNAAGTLSRPDRVATAGTLIVRSTPPRAAVTLNGKWRGRTPLTLDPVPFGSYDVRIVQRGFRVQREDVTLTARNASRTINARLEPNPVAPAPRTPIVTPPRPDAVRPRPGQTVSFTGSLYVDSRPRGATIILDGKTIGQTPLSLPEVAVGSHVVRLEMAGKQTWTTTARVTAGQRTPVTGSLEDR